MKPSTSSSIRRKRKFPSTARKRKAAAAAAVSQRPLRGDLHLLAQQMAAPAMSPALASLLRAYRRHPTSANAARLLCGARALYVSAAAELTGE
jgi:hypothetical protein